MIGLNEGKLRYPGLGIVGAFAATIGLGALLLLLPVSQRSGGVGPMEALFTAASAVTVTGLVVVDTGSAFSPIGQVVILGLIQIGGLGIMTLAGLFGIALNQRLGLWRGLAAATEIGVADIGEMRKLLRDLIRFVAASEAVLAALLTLGFLADGEGPARAAYLGIFHSISAFNNAGFSVIAGGLEPYVGNWYLNLVIVAGFVLGGLGFPVVFEVRERWRGPRTWSLHTKVTLATTAVLLVSGTVLIALSEWTNDATLGTRPLDERILASFFHSATARTAGFNTVPIGALRPAGWLALLLLMVVGAGSASTGGGIKVSTFAVVIRSTLSELRGDEATTLFERMVPVTIQRQALSLVVAALGAVGTGAFLLSLFQPSIPSTELLFEAASAFGTVGVSTGATPQLSDVNRLVIMCLMFLGRVGPITFGTAVLIRGQRRRYGYASEDLLVG